MVSHMLGDRPSPWDYLISEFVGTGSSASVLERAVREREKTYSKSQKCLLELAVMVEEVEEISKISLFWSDVEMSWGLTWSLHVRFYSRASPKTKWLRNLTDRRESICIIKQQMWWRPKSLESWSYILQQVPRKEKIQMDNLNTYSILISEKKRIWEKQIKEGVSGRIYLCIWWFKTQ